MPLFPAAPPARNDASPAFPNAAFAHRRVEKHCRAIVDLPGADLKEQGGMVHGMNNSGKLRSQGLRGHKGQGLSLRQPKF